MWRYRNPMTPDSLKWLLEYSMAAYESELSSTEKLKDRIIFMLSIVIAPFFGVFIYLAINLKGKSLSSFSNLIFFWAPWGIAIVILLASTILIASALLRGFYYARVPLPSEMLPYFEEHPEPEKALEEAQSALLKEYAASVEHNSKQNQERYKLSLRSQRFAFLAALFTIGCLPIWLYNAIQYAPEPQPIKIVSRAEIAKEKSMSSSNASSSNPVSHQQTQSPTQQSASMTPSATVSETQVQVQAQEPAPATPPATAPQTRPPFPARTMVLDSVDVVGE